VDLALFAVIGGALVLILRDGPYALPNQPFDIRQITSVFRNRGVRLANFGYFGHMWELYAMWTWAPAMIRASVAASGGRAAVAASFAVIGSSAIGCIVAGLLADRIGRTVVASAAMAISGACCLAIGFLYGRSEYALLAIAIVWGASVVADSAQFSACVTELGDPLYIGTALTLQTSIGFLINTLTIRPLPMLVDAVGWRFAFAALAPGPFLGIIAMLRLRSLPEARLLAGGRGQEHRCVTMHTMDTTIRNLDADVYRQLKAKAALQGKTVGEALNEAIRAWLGGGPLVRNGTLGDLQPRSWGAKHKRDSEEIDHIVYGRRS
jgi:MFS family permease